MTYRYEVSYEVPYTHRVTVGVTARSKEEAIQIASEAFDAATLWENTPDMPLLEDEYYEKDDGSVFGFEAERVETFTEDASASAVRRERRALAACRHILLAYRRGEAAGGKIDWSDVDEAYALAAQAIPDEAG